MLKKSGQTHNFNVFKDHVEQYPFTPFRKHSFTSNFYQPLRGRFCGAKSGVKTTKRSQKPLPRLGEDKKILFGHLPGVF